MKAGSLRPDDELGALRESASSPSSGEVCLEVCSRLVSLCLHLFFITYIHKHKGTCSSVGRARHCEGRGHAFESRQVLQIYVGCSSMSEPCTVTAVVAGLSPVSPPKPTRSCGREVRHLVVNQADDGSSPFSSANASVAKLAQGTCLLSRGL